MNNHNIEHGSLSQPIHIDASMELPEELSKVREKWQGFAKTMNGNGVCLICMDVEKIVFNYREKLYEVDRDTFCMDRDFFEFAYEDICEDLISIGCKIKFPEMIKHDNV